MGRFALREFSTPQYAGYIPQETDPEGRPVQQLEKFATFLNEIPWFSKGEDDSQSEQSSAEGFLQGSGAGVTDKEVEQAVTDKLLKDIDPTQSIRDKVEGPAPLGQDVTLQLMRGAGSDVDQFGQALNLALDKREKENQLFDMMPRQDLWDTAKDGEQRNQQETPRPNTADPNSVKEWQKFLKVKVDGNWGPKSQAAYDKWVSTYNGGI